MSIKLNLMPLLLRLQVEQGRQIPVSEVARATGISDTRIRRYFHDDIPRVDLGILNALYEYFIRGGLDIYIGDLFIDKPAGEDQ